MKASYFLLFAAIPFAAVAQQWNWTEHGYPEEGFSIEFNGIVTVKPLQLAGTSSRIVRGTQYTHSEGTQVYSVAASLSKSGVNLAEGALQSFARLECGKKLAESEVDRPWGRGLALRGEHCIDGTYQVEAQYHRAGAWFYQVVALYKHKGGNESLARYFLDSFRVTR